VERASHHRRFVRAGGLTLAVAAVYVLSAQVGLLEDLVHGQIAPLWPPAGVALVCLLLGGWRTWPGIAAGAVVVGVVSVGSAGPVGLATAVGNTLAAVLAYLLLRRLGFRPALDRLRDAVALVVAGVVVGPLVSASVGSAAMVLSGGVPLPQLWSTWSLWWSGDAMGVIIVVPLALAVRQIRTPSTVRPHRIVEAAGLVIGTVAVTILAMHGPFDLLFLVFPFLVWAALRFRLGGAAPCAVIVVAIAIYATANGFGPFSGHGFFTDMVSFQAFDASAALTALLLAVIITERDHAYHDIERACTQLGAAVVRLQESLRPVPHAQSWQRSAGHRRPDP
jgi:integral membrane sensor domain MASE1